MDLTRRLWPALSSLRTTPPAAFGRARHQATPTSNLLSTLAVAANGITLAPPHGAYYTDVCGAALTTAGLKARADLTNAAWVGNGIIPPDLGHTANCATGDPGPTRGVLIQGHKSVGTFMVGMVGINTWEIQTNLDGGIYVWRMRVVPGLRVPAHRLPDQHHQLRRLGQGGRPGFALAARDDLHLPALQEGSRVTSAGST